MPNPWHPSQDAFQCDWQGCTKHPSQGGGVLIRRVSPKGEPFRGLCEEHYALAALRSQREGE